jgi:serine/threonine-protein kinase HipA
MRRLYSLKKISPIFTKRKIDHVIDEITEHVSEWNNLAIEHMVPQSFIKIINSNLRLTI